MNNRTAASNRLPSITEATRSNEQQSVRLKVLVDKEVSDITSDFVSRHEVGISMQHKYDGPLDDA